MAAESRLPRAATPAPRERAAERAAWITSPRVSLACRICSAPLEPYRSGSQGRPSPARLSPTNHVPGQHGDLYRCRNCGAVDQPSLPTGRALHELYREMRDDSYLAEEAGRRAAARRLLDLLARGRAPGRLLDIGCGHGLLLDEARRAGWEAVGLELSTHAAAYAHDVLGADVREVAFEDFDPGARRFDAVLIVDVFEHLADPPAALDRCVELLAPGGLLCIVTPDPSSLTAKIAGRKWWAYVPAHACLIPRRTLRDLLIARGLEVSDDVPFVRTFTRRYWASGMAERGGPLGALAGALARGPGADRRLSLSLGDERVLIARRGADVSATSAAEALGPRAVAAARAQGAS